jgi:hypothetical protein
MTFPQTWHEWFSLAERGVLRMLMIGIGLALMIAGLALGVSMIMLPPGLLLGFTGLGLVVWGTLGDLPLDR